MNRELVGRLLRTSSVLRWSSSASSGLGLSLIWTGVQAVNAKATTDGALGPSEGEKDARVIDHAAQSGASSSEHRHDGLAEEEGIRGIAEKYRRGDLRVIVEFDPDPPSADDSANAGGCRNRVDSVDIARSKHHRGVIHAPITESDTGGSDQGGERHMFVNLIAVIHGPNNFSAPPSYAPIRRKNSLASSDATKALHLDSYSWAVRPRGNWVHLLRVPHTPMTSHAM